MPKEKTSRHDTSFDRDPTIERHSIDYIPLEDRRPDKLWQLGTFWFMWVANITAVSTGFLGVSLGLGIVWTILVVILGCLFGTLFTASHSAQGPQMGLPQMVQSRAQFGYVGAILPLTIAFVILVGFNVFNASLIGAVLNQTVGLPTNLGIALSCVLAAVLATVGYKWVHYAMRLLFVALVPIFGVLTVHVIVTFKVSTEAPSASAFNWSGAVVVFVAAAAFQIAYAPYVSDYSRYYSPDVKPSRTLFWTFLGTAGAGIWFIVLGALLASRFPSVTSPVTAIGQSADRVFTGYGNIVLVYSALVLIVVFGANTYSAGLAFLGITDAAKDSAENSAISKPPSVFTRTAVVVASAAFAGVVGATATSNFISNFGTFLTLLTYLLVPWTMVNLIDFYFVRHGHYSITELFNPRGMYGRIGWRGLSSYAIGFLVMVPFFNIWSYHGPLATHLFGGVDISMFVGLLVSGLTYLGLSRGIDVAGELRTAQNDILTPGSAAAAHSDTPHG